MSGRQLLEAVAGSQLEHRATTHEDLTQRLRAGLRRKILNLDASDGGSGAEGEQDELPPEIQEELTLDYLARHYRAWLDDSIPALDDSTPREAPSLRSCARNW